MQLGSFAQGAASLAPAGMESQSKLRNEDNSKSLEQLETETIFKAAKLDHNIFPHSMLLRTSANSSSLLVPRSPQLSTHEMAGAQSLPMPIRPLFSSSPTRISPIEEELSCNTTAPQRTPSPPTSALPLRHPETLGTLISIQTSEGKGLGVFALCDIEPGTVLLSESPLITLIDTGTRADPLEATIAALPSPQRQSFLSLSHYSRNVNESRNRSIVYSNGYSIMKDMATGVFETASRINHSCVPNSGYVWKDDIGRMVGVEISCFMK